MYYKIPKHKLQKDYQEIKLKRYLNLQKHSFHSKEYEVMVPVSKGSVVLRRKQVIIYDHAVSLVILLNRSQITISEHLPP